VRDGCDDAVPRRSTLALGFMDTKAPTLEELSSLLEEETARISSPNRRAFVQGIRISPYRTQLNWEYGADEPFDAWTFGDLGERNVVAQYCRGGFGALGSPWGINFRDERNFGMDCGWYSTLEALIEDWGVPE